MVSSVRRDPPEGPKRMKTKEFTIFTKLGEWLVTCKPLKTKTITIITIITK
jgi:hypothetical protein